jgi:hypothetical protein
MEVFQNMWFTPVRERPSLDSAALLRKVMNITDVVAASRDMGLEWFEQLLLSVSIYQNMLLLFVALLSIFKQNGKLFINMFAAISKDGHLLVLCLDYHI